MFRYSRLLHVISRLILWPSRLVSCLTIFFSEYVSNFKFDSSFLSSGAMIDRIDEVCIGVGKSYGQ